MNMVEPAGCWDGLFANGIAGDEEFELLGALDFPMESLEDDDDSIGDWDASKSEFLGPIPSDLLIGPGSVAVTQKINAAPKQKRPHSDVKEFSGPHIRRHNKFSEVKDSSAFQIQSPVSVLESNGSSSSKTLLPIKSNIVIPVRTRSKRVRPSGPNPWLSISPLPAPTKKTSNAKKIRERMKKPTQIETMMKDSSQVSSDHKELQNGKKCTHCEITKTPQWREGPMGPKTLCNACGVRYRSGRLFPEYRPAASPTFVPSLHSNSHRKVIEMRSKGKQQPQATRVVEDAPPISPQLEFVPMSSYLFDFV